MKLSFIALGALIQLFDVWKFGVNCDWILPCHASRSSCDASCKTRHPNYWTCHQESGYCLCPGKSKPEPNCRLPHYNSSESQSCKSEVCDSLKKGKGDAHHRDQNKVWLQKKHPTLVGAYDRRVPMALVCPQESNSGGTKEYAYCACFMLSSKYKKGAESAQQS